MTPAPNPGGRKSFPPGPWCMWALGALTALLLASPSLAQCEQWLPGEGIPGTTREVRALMTWDPDGPQGPQPPMLVLGGVFNLAGTSLSASIAGWDGTRWREFGPGLGYGQTSTVRCLGTFQGRLVAAWTLEYEAAGSSVSQWDGTSWHTLGTGLTSNPISLIEFGGELLACGATFDHSPVAPAPPRRFNGTNWQPFGPSGVSLVRLAMFNDDLIGMGTFTDGGSTPVAGIRRWAGTQWVPLGTGLTVSSSLTRSGLRSSSTNLYALGSFVANGVQCAVVRWDGSTWIPMGTPLIGGGFGSDIEVLNGMPIATLGDVASMWTGNAWQQLGSTPGPSNYALAAFNGHAYLGGHFRYVGNTHTSFIARWNGSAWESVGPGISYFESPGPARIESLKEFHGEMIAGGSFDTIGLVAAHGIARWDGAAWHPFAPSLAGYPIEVMALGEFGGELIVAGSFASAGQVTLNGIARWNGAAWRAFTASGVSSSSDSHAVVQSMATYQGDLVIGGTVTSAGGVPVHHVARWDGAQWHDVGGGTDGYGVYALAVFQNQLIATGNFANAGGVSAPAIASWDGTQWRPLGPGPTPPASPVVGFSLCVHNNELVCGSAYTNSGGGTLISAWDGTSWRNLRDGPGSAPYCCTRALMSRNGHLFAVGNHLVDRWDGSMWRPFGTGIGSLWGFGGAGTALAVAPFGDQVFLGGDFSVVNSAVNVGWARWTDNIPAIQQQPLGSNVCIGTPRTLTIAAASTAAPAYQWKKNGSDLADSDNISGSSTPQLLIAHVRSSDTGLYTCAVSTSCGTALSDPAALTTCPADFNCDSSVSVQDIYDFIQAWFAADPRADFNGSGALTGFDIFDYIAAWFAGCP